METRQFGRTDLEVSRLTFGCGAVGGLMTAGNAGDQDNAVAWARDNGINFFDTAPSYGHHASENNLGRALGRNREGIIVGTKVRVSELDKSDLSGEIRSSLEASLKRIKQDRVDVFQLHDPLGSPDVGSPDVDSPDVGSPDNQAGLSVDQVLSEIVPVFRQLRDEGKTRYLGFTARGDTGALHKLVESGCFDSAQIFYNLLVPSAGETIPIGYPAQDYHQLLDAAKQRGVGSIGVRVLAGGALSGNEGRHPLGMPIVSPIGSGNDYATDVRRSLDFMPLLVSGQAVSLTELAIRYAISNPVLATTEVGIATIDELQQATAAVNKGPLPEDALVEIRRIQAGFAT